MLGLYIATRWGNDESEDGPNGRDTSFLVQAELWSDAVALVDDLLARAPHPLLQSFCHRVTKVGHSSLSVKDTCILLGPVIGHPPFTVGFDDNDGNLTSSDLTESWCRYDDTGEWVRADEY